LSAQHNFAPRHSSALSRHTLRLERDPETSPHLEVPPCEQLIHDRRNWTTTITKTEWATKSTRVGKNSCGKGPEWFHSVMITQSVRSPWTIALDHILKLFCAIIPCMFHTRVFNAATVVIKARKAPWRRFRISSAIGTQNSTKECCHEYILSEATSRADLQSISRLR
jgi:hypothetical protein